MPRMSPRGEGDVGTLMCFHWSLTGVFNLIESLFYFRVCCHTSFPGRKMKNQAGKVSVYMVLKCVCQRESRGEKEGRPAGGELGLKQGGVMEVGWWVGGCKSGGLWGAHLRAIAACDKTQT